MLERMRRFIFFLLFAGMLPGAVSPALEAYLAGLDSIRQGQYADAATALTRAIGTQQDPAFYLARGVALCLGGKPQDAIADLQRAKQGRELGREPELWIYITETIYAFATPDHRFGGPRAPATSAVSMPGNMMQGGDDYSTEYASFVFQEMARPVQIARERRTPAPSAADFNRMKLQAGAYFANRAATRKDLAEAHLARAVTLHTAGKFADVIQTAKFIEPAYPDDPQTLYLVGDSWSALGRPVTARKLLTLALINSPEYPDPYVSRALAAARMGDEQRARADLGVVQKLKPDYYSKYKPDIEKEIAANKVTGDWHAMYDNLVKEARSGAQMDTLVEHAMQFVRAANNGRKHYDEWYQDQWHQLDLAIAANPKDPGPLAKAARFLVDEADPIQRGEEVEPRHGLVPFRTQTSERAEIQKAIALCDAGLKLNQNHVPSLMTKALALERLGQDQQAEQIVNYTLQVAPKDPQALSMRGEFLIDHANGMFAQATALRTPRTTMNSHQETRSDGVYNVTVTTYIPPSPQALAQASQEEEEAREYMQRSEATVQAALAVSKGTWDGLMLQAQWDMNSGRGDAARNELMQAIKQQPQSLKANYELADLYSRSGQTELMEQQRHLTMNLVEMSCGWMLHQAWRAINAGNAQAVGKALDMARLYDPTDGRVAEYTARFAQMTNNQAEVRPQLQVALAIEEAKLRLDEYNASGVNLPRDMQTLALNLRLRNNLGGPLVASNPNAAIELLEPGAVWAKRTPRAGRSTEMFGAMLPRANAQPIPVPAPENAATVLAEVALNYGKALKAAGRTDDALAEFLLVVDMGFKKDVVGIGNGNGETNYSGVAVNRVTGDARAQAGRILMDRHDCQGAVNVTENGGALGPLNPATNETPEASRERSQVFAQAMACIGRPLPPAFLNQFNTPRPGPPQR
jgi:tetratricopeptide (TPR) repeat protein